MIKTKVSKKNAKFLEDYGISVEDLSDIYTIYYKSGEYVLSQGHEITHLYFIISGKLKVIFTAPNGRQLLLRSYDSGIIGDIELMLGAGDAKSSVQAITDAEIIAVPFLKYADRLKANIGFMNMLGAGLAEKLNQSSRNNSVNILNSLESRLCSYILLTNVDGHFSEKKTIVSEMLGTSYRHLLRTFDRLCSSGILKKEKNGYKISNYEKLKDNGDDYYLE